jgi:hypothetical protein
VQKNRTNLARRNMGSALVLAALLPPLLFWGCGQRIGKPQETPGGTPPPPNTYVLTFERTNFPGVTDMIVTAGGFVYVAQDSARVTAYTTFLSQKHPLIADLTGLVKPVLLAEGVNDEVYVADAADTTVKRFSPTGGAPIQVVRDTAWTVLGGIAVDNLGFLYVADRQREFIWKYRPSGERDSSLRHPTLGTPGLLTEGGEGLGYVRSPGDLCFDGTYLQVTDTGKKRVQKLATSEFALGIFSVAFTDSDTTVTPHVEYTLTPVASHFDHQGNIYVSYRRIGGILDKVTKFDGSGEAVATVTRDPAAVIGTAVAVIAREQYVYVADPEHSRILIYELRQ